VDFCAATLRGGVFPKDDLIASTKVGGLSAAGPARVTYEEEDRMKRIAYVIALGFIMLCWTLSFQRDNPGLQRIVIVGESFLMAGLLAMKFDDEGKDSSK